MLSDILSAIKSVFDISKIIKNDKLKSTLVILIILSIVLVKPTIYYANLYIGFCYLFAAIFAILFFIMIIYRIYCNKTNTDYHSATNYTLTGFFFIIALFLFIGIIGYDYVWGNVFSAEEIKREIFVKCVHDLEYFNVFYSYVRSNFLVVLLYTIEFIQTLSILYFVLYFSHKLLYTKSPLELGFTSSDWETMILNVLIIVFTSPIWFSAYTTFWNKIF